MLSEAHFQRHPSPSAFSLGWITPLLSPSAGGMSDNPIPIGIAFSISMYVELWHLTEFVIPLSGLDAQLFGMGMVSVTASKSLCKRYLKQLSHTEYLPECGISPGSLLLQATALTKETSFRLPLNVESFN